MGRLRRMRTRTRTNHEPADAGSAREGWRFPLVVLAVFLGLTGFMLTRHEMFRDEIQAWLIARDTSLLSLWRHLRYEGHPALWYLLLMPLTRLTLSPHAMQVLHLAITGGAVLVWLRAAPFSRLQRLLFVFGYYVSFEYVILSRNYGIGLLLCMAFCAVYAARRPRPLALAGLLALLANTSIHGAVVAMAAAIGVGVDQALRRRVGVGSPPVAVPGHRRWVLAAGLFAAGFLLAVWSVRPAPDGGYLPEWVLSVDPRRAAQVLTQVPNAYLPVPQWKADFWNSNVLYQLPANDALRLLLALGMLALALLALAATPAALGLFVCGSGALGALFYLKYIGYLRHHGFLFLLFLMALWLRPCCVRVPLPGWLARLQVPAVAGASRLLTFCLAAQVLGAAVALSWDARHAWTPASAVSAYLQAHRGDRLVVGLSDWQAAVAAGPLSREPHYQPRGRRFGTFVQLDTARDEPLADTFAIQDALAVGRARGQACLLISGRAIRADILARCGLRLEAAFPPGLLPDEAFFLYAGPVP